MIHSAHISPIDFGESPCQVGKCGTGLSGFIVAWGPPGANARVQAIPFPYGDQRQKFVASVQ